MTNPRNAPDHVMVGVAVRHLSHDSFESLVKVSSEKDELKHQQWLVEVDWLRRSNRRQPSRDEYYKLVL